MMPGPVVRPAARALALATLCTAFCAVSCGRVGAGASSEAPARPEPAASAAVGNPGRPGVGDVALAPGQALLVEGSAPADGLPGFDRNAFKAIRGAYAYRPAGGDARYSLRVWHTYEPLLFGDGWTATDCARLPSGWLARAAVPSEGGSSLWAMSSGNSALLMEFPAGMPEPCRFAAALVERFAYFSRYAEGPGDLSFPATLVIGREGLRR